MKSGYQLARLLAYVTGLVNQELLLQVEYLGVENRILRAHAPERLPYGPDTQAVAVSCHIIRIAAAMIEARRVPTGASHSHGRGQCGAFF